MQIPEIKKIVRSRRRSLALIVTPQAELVVRAPLIMPRIVINNFIRRKINWIKRKIEAAQLQNQGFKPKQFVNGEDFLYLGKTYRLKIVESKNIAISDFLEFPRKFLTQPKENLTEWYKLEAKERFLESAERYAQIMGLKYSKLKVSSAQKRWGSCTASNTLNLSWRLILAPQEIIDYVVVHELAHIQEKNHSCRFWNKVAAILPDYRLRKKWLRSNEHSLNI